MSNARNLSNFRPSTSGQVETADIADAAVTAGKLDTGAAASNLGNYVSTVNGSTGAVTVQETLVSGTNIKTVNSTSLLGSGDVAVQATLVSGTNIKTINSTSLLGSGDITVGSSTDYLAIGTYVLATRGPNNNFSANGTVSGSSLKTVYFGFNDSDYYGYARGYTNDLTIGASGTWRAMSNGWTDNGRYSWGLFVRIS